MAEASRGHIATRKGQRIVSELGWAVSTRQHNFFFSDQAWAEIRERDLLEFLTEYLRSLREDGLQAPVLGMQATRCYGILRLEESAAPRQDQEPQEPAADPDSESANPRLYRDREGRCPAHDADVCEVCPGDTLAAKLSPLEILAEEMATQDNAGTAEPLFVVFQKTRVYGLETNYTDLFEWTREDEAVDPDLAENLEAGRWAGCPCPDGYRRVGYTEVDEFVTACLTRKAAERYIRENQHNLREPFVYVESGYRNEEWIELRHFLAALLPAKKGEEAA